MIYFTGSGIRFKAPCFQMVKKLYLLPLQVLAWARRGLNMFFGLGVGIVKVR